MARKRTIPRIAVIYTHFPHYRSGVFDALGRNTSYDFQFFSQPYPPGSVKNLSYFGPMDGYARSLVGRALQDEFSIGWLIAYWCTAYEEKKLVYPLGSAPRKFML